MLAKALKKIRRQIVLLAIVALVLLAAYVSLGRQFMPAVAGYTEFFEERISRLAGVPVTIDALTGSFSGFNPVLEISGLSLRVATTAGGAESDPSSAGAIYFESATIIVDVPRSIWRRQWVLEDFAVDNLEINVEQTQEGNWQLQGLSMGGGEPVELASVYESFLGISRLDLERVGINFLSRNGENYRFNDGTASIRNQDSTHFLYISAFPQNSRVAIDLSLEVSGQSLATMSGSLHADVPVGNYSKILADQYTQQLEILEFVGGAQLWVKLESGQARELLLEPQVSRLAFKGPHSEGTAIEQINGLIGVILSEQSTSIDLSRMYVSWGGINWLDFNAAVTIDEQQVSFIADRINIELLSGVLGGSGLLNESSQTQLDLYSPKGRLEQFSVSSSLLDNSIQQLELRTNVAQAELGSVRGSPNLWGMDGYIELDFDSVAGLISGFGEIESDNFRMNIPNVFNSTWDYSYANGSLDFEVDLNNGEEIKLVSSVIVAESDAVDAHAQFASHIHRFPDGSRLAELDLYVGTTRMDAQQKALYLPDGPNVDDNLRNSMDWVNSAVRSGEIRNAGVLYRGSTLPGAPSQTKTFQSFFDLEQGQLLYSEEWPELEQLDALVSISDNDVDVSVQSATSLGLNLDKAIGTIRRDEQGENWVKIEGAAGGQLADGLSFLQQAGVGDEIKEAFSTWQVQGGFAANVIVEVPLSAADSGTEVRLEVALDDNSLEIPEYYLEFSEVKGPVIFDSRNGVETTELSGILFDQPVNLILSSAMNGDQLETIILDSQGTADPESLIEWPMQSEFVADLLQTMEGEFEFTSRLTLEQSGSANRPNTLSINSSLLGASLALPKPFSKGRDEELSLALNFLLEEPQQISGQLGDNLAFQMTVSDSVISEGLVYVGEDIENVENLAADGTQGLAIVGELSDFELEQWIAFLEGMGDEAEGDALNSAIAFVDVSIANFELYDQDLNNVAMRIDPSPNLPAWAVRLVGESILGQVDIPFSDEDYLLVDLEYLRLPADEEELSTELDLELEPPEEVDVLVDIDPRELPKMVFATDEFRIGESDYGSWQFTLDPIQAGAELSKLSFDFRGLRLGLDETDVDAEPDGESQPLIPHFTWLYDGENHTSQLEGLLHADNMADVLTANGLAAVFESRTARFASDIEWPGSPAFFAASALSGSIDMQIENGRFLQDAGGNGALKLISIINFDAIMRRLRFSDDLLRRGLAYDEITANLDLVDGLVNIEDRLVISGPSSVYQITGNLDLESETIDGELYVTLPVSRNIPWIGVLTANIPLAVGAYLFDRIFGDQVNSLTSAVYILDGPWEGLEPEFKQAFGSPEDVPEAN